MTIDMSSLLSRSTAVVGRKDRKRSESVSGLSRVKEARRIPAIGVNENRDVATLVAIEISRAIMIKPELDLGIFLKSAMNSRRDLSISDATILISTAILDHIGNKRMASELLRTSSTLTKYYDKMGLNDSVIRELMVTMLFALSPEFVKMIETSITLAVDRSASKGTTTHSESRIANALVNLTEQGTLSGAELIKASVIDDNYEMGPRTLARESSIQKTPTELIAPSDSASVANDVRKPRAVVNEKDIIELIGRRRSGVEPRFDLTFPRSKKAIEIQANKGKRGLGYSPVKTTSNIFAAEMDNILGSGRFKSYNIKTGDVQERRPTVEDYLESEGLSSSVLFSPPDSSNVNYSYVNPNSVRRPEPTESYLPRSVYNSPEEARPTLREVDSLEDLRDRISNM